LADVDQAKAELETVSQARAEHSRNGGVDDVGLAGERYLAAELGEFADRARALYEELAAEPAFAAWRADHAAIDPLYDTWLDGELSNLTAPPRLYTDWTALSKEHGAILEPDEEGGRAVTDHCGQPWRIGLATTGPTAAVIAWRDHDGPPTGAVYLLAHEVDAVQAAETIASGLASLAAVTAALHST
jgi:hypothetical protein